MALVGFIIHYKNRAVFHFLHFNSLSTPRAETDPRAAILCKRCDGPFGQPLALTLAGPSGYPYSDPQKVRFLR